MEALKDLKWLIGIMVIIWFVWFFTGGPQRFERNSKPFLRPAAPIDTGETYGPEKLELKTDYFQVRQKN